MQSANWVSAENGLCVVQTTEINEFGTGSNYVFFYGNWIHFIMHGVNHKREQYSYAQQFAYYSNERLGIVHFDL